MLPLLAPILSQLAGAGMQKVADAVMDKGLDVVEAKLVSDFDLLWKRWLATR